MADAAMSLLSLEDDLTCSICLCPFDNPVSLICGHSFCLVCLEETWKDAVSLFCPHCRAHYHTKPELKKNTVLSAVVETFKSKSLESSADGQVPGKEPKQVMCDTCMEAPAVNTCLTCMANFCVVHVRPHQENPIFRAHQLIEPLADLSEMLCPDHGKMTEFYCGDHDRSICSSCLQQNHKGCRFSSPEEQRVKKESEMKDKLGTLDSKIEKNQLVISQMREQQAKLKDIAAVRKRALEMEYQQIRDMLQKDEKEAMDALEKDLETGQSKLNTLIKRFNHNIEKMSATTAKINSLLGQSHSLDFLQASVHMPSEVNFDPYAPRINLDSKQVIAFHSSIVLLKDMISKVLKQQVEMRVSAFKPDSGAGEDIRPTSPGLKDRDVPSGARKKPNPRDKKENKGDRKEHKAHAQPKEKEPKGDRARRVPQQGMNSAFSKSMDNLGPDLALHIPMCPDTTKMQFFCPVPVQMGSVPVTGLKRSDLLKYSTILTFDPKTAHKRVALSENNTKASVSDEPSMYPDHPARFTVCSQVLCSKGFSQGCHYWEVKMSSCNFCGLGLAYGSLDRKGPSSRLGRNAESWCVEWFNVKLSAWHNSAETVLSNPNPSRVGVLLDCNEGSATFYIVADRAYPFHTFVFPFSQAVYPAFWIFSSGSSISLCKLSN
ncbi:E3 ubiquitin/ISG15 ligase TRIM25 isoform X2 [Electrophorus electricus]|uniref:RING-type E3 ubiquitin transferase n=1 Tax=Electrophorus electricus TaxID=8005 RepID=A0A4W4EJR4_ELEEL|nr:E3 ubiquitin/ISG15 ligase TRIM25 isoform X2 [Electrophorus electricus]